jgi:hypothetical protein
VYALDHTFLHAVREAAQGRGALLDDILRSGAHLGEGERAEIALLDTGALRPVRRAGERGGALTQDQQRLYAARYLVGGSNKAVMGEIVDETGMDRSTVLGWVRTLKVSLKRAPDPDHVLRSIVDPEGEFDRIMQRVREATAKALHEQKAP